MKENDIFRKILANMFAHFQQETAGLVYLREINKSNYCATWSNWSAENTRRMIPHSKHVTFHQGHSCLPVLPWQAILWPGRQAAELELQLWYIICRRLSSMIRLSHLFTTVVLCGMTELRSSKHYPLIIPFVGAFSRAMYGDSSVLLKNPELVADTWLNFASALWYL